MIRRATADDFAAVMSFTPMMKTQALFAYDEMKMQAEILATITAGQAFVALAGVEMVGTVAYAVEAQWYSSELALYDKWMAVREDHRGGVLAGKLILSLENEAERLGLSFLPGVSGDLSNAAVFKRRYRKVGEQFMKEFKRCA